MWVKVNEEGLDINETKKAMKGNLEYKNLCSISINSLKSVNKSLKLLKEI